MKKYVVLGVNENPKYLYYLPLVIWAWRQFGWDAIVFNTGNNDTSPKGLATHGLMVRTIPYKYDLNNIFFTNVQGFKTETVAQVSRLYGGLAVKHPRCIVMTSDCDMLPLSNYWNPSDLNVTCYGRDLTDYHYPICYAAMTPMKWLDVMMYTDEDYNKCIKQDLDERPANSNPWLWDQDILTERLNKYGKRLLTLMPRGTDKRTGYPIGRVDRSHWTLDHPKLIDAHLPHDILTNDKSFHKVMELLHHVWPSEDWKWFIEYHKEFKKLL